MSSHRVRLVKVIAQPVFVIDDGEHLQEQAAQPVEVPAAEWPSYASGRFLRDVAVLQEQLDAAAEQASAPPD